jgi:2-aminoadipate transaminase
MEVNHAERRGHLNRGEQSTLVSHPDAGAWIESLQRYSAESPRVLALGGGLPAEEMFPRSQIADAFLASLRVPSCPALQYGWPEGDPGLREWIACRLRRRGARVDAEDVIVTNGAQQALAIAAELLLSPGARVAVDRFTYPAALDLFRTRGARPVEGIRDVACAYVMSGVANPTGSALSESSREELLASGLPILEDQAYSELRFDGVIDRPLLADARERIWHVGTFSKTLCPGFRVGWLIPPRGAVKPALRLKRDRDLQAGSLAQQVVRAFLAKYDFEDHLARARRFYEARALRLVRGLRRRFPRSWRISDPIGGFSVMVETHLDGDDVQLLALATDQGMSFDPGRLFRPGEESSPIAFRLCYSALDPALLDQALARLERAVQVFEAEQRPSPGTR